MHKEKETHTVIREYNEADKNAVINLIRLNTPDFFSPNEEKDLINYLETEREFYYVLLFDGRIVGCGGINFADNKTIGKISWDIFHPDYQGKSLGTKLLKHRIDKLNSIDSIQKLLLEPHKLLINFTRNRVLNYLKL